MKIQENGLKISVSKNSIIKTGVIIASKVLTKISENDSIIDYTKHRTARKIYF